MSFFDPFMNSLMGITPNGDGTVTMNASGLTVPSDPFSLPTFNVSSDANGIATPAATAGPVYTQNPFQQWVTGVLVGNSNPLTAIPGTVPAGQTTVPGTIVKQTWTDSLTSGADNVLVTAAVLLLAVLVVALGLWSIVK